MIAIGSVGPLLGLQPVRDEESTFAIMAQIQKGLPLSTLDRVARVLAPDDGHFRYRVVPRATLARRKANHRLSAEESARVARLARVWTLARDVWGGDEAARDFLFRLHPMMNDRRPMDLVIESEFGGELVLDVLGGLRYGSAA